MRGLNQWGLQMDTNHPIPCLDLIVKNGAQLSHAALRQYAGSTDGTQHAIRTYMADLICPERCTGATSPTIETHVQNDTRRYDC